MSSPARVMNDLLPSSDVVWQGQSISSRSSQAPQESYPGSTEVSTISLPEPSALLEECFNSPGPKGKAPVPTAIMPTTPAKIHTIDIDSLSPLSSIPSDYAPSLHGGNLSIRPPGNRAGSGVARHQDLNVRNPRNDLENEPKLHPQRKRRKSYWMKAIY
ncbi:hypothetical protein K439DRAFT_852931 [Ramaria rubella]|nr:hypothetical protein K439DRAFT_852931 [Ramaria rubella]